MVLTRATGSYLQETLTFSMTQPPSLLWRFGAESVTIKRMQRQLSLSLSLFVYLCLSLYLFRYLSISFYLFPSLSIHPSICQTVCLSVGSSVCLSVCLFLDRRFLCNSHQGVNRVGGGCLRDAGCERGKVKRTQRY